ncbi:MAG: transposase [Clostridiaceae bacterium]|nr:transposase [Clostridiaceae bacterium]MBW4859748.1 transposase [Clostridiaceae bacterium]MBW4869822.1 transposase [Clostridiaceae bacterium]
MQRIPLILIKQIIGQTDFIEEQLKDFEIKNSTLIHQTNQVITTITEIGNVLNDISRFESAPQLVAYANIAIAVKQSYDFIGTQIKIPKHSSPYLRRTIWPADNVYKTNLFIW